MSLFDKPRILVCLGILSCVAGCASSGWVSGLQPIDPPMPMLRTPKVASLQPTLSWESFPGGYDRRSDPEGGLNSITQITYELKIWPAQLLYGETHAVDTIPPLDTTYIRTGLLETQHKVAVPLAADTAYSWTVRARFKLGNDPAINTWAGWHPAGVPKTRENWRPHRFRTPTEANSSSQRTVSQAR